MSATLEENMRKLNEHREQLAQVEQLVAASPNDPELLNLKKDLLQVIELTEGLIKEATKSNPLAMSAETKSKIKYKRGDRVRALWSEDGKYYTARIESVSEVNTYLVVYLRYGNTAELPESALQPYIPAAESSLGKGVPVWAVWKENGMVYEGVIEEKLENGRYRVIFESFRKKADVVPYDIRLRKSDEQKDEATERVFIPEKLRILPTDSDKVKEIKKKKVKRIKSQFRNKKLEAEQTKKKSTWDSFKQAGPVKVKKSIFASPDSVDGRVGVTGSGKGMTQQLVDTTKKPTLLGSDAAPKVHLPTPQELDRITMQELVASAPSASGALNNVNAYTLNQQRLSGI